MTFMGKARVESQVQMLMFQPLGQASWATSRWTTRTCLLDKDAEIRSHEETQFTAQKPSEMSKTFSEGQQAPCHDSAC